MINRPDGSLKRQATRAGVQTQFQGRHGETVYASTAAVNGVLAALGEERADPLATVVAWDGVVAPLPRGVTILLESGAAGDPAHPVPLGYHTLMRGGRAVGTLIAAPTLAPAATSGQWGVFLPLYSLRADADSSLSTYTDLDALFEWLAGHGGQAVLTLPLLPMFLDAPADWSPYSPVTRRMWNELYLDLSAWGQGPTDASPRPVDDLLDYPALHADQVARLDAVVDQVWPNPSLHRFAADNPLVQRYAWFRAAQARHGRNWRAWPAKLAVGSTDVDPLVHRRHLAAAWLADQQLTALADRAASRGQYLALDVALGTHSDGFDTWDCGDLFATGASVGAPPDPVFVGGQDWGFPPVHPERSRRTGHRYLRDTLRHHLRFAKLLRLDHVMGLARQWWVPHGLPATDGAYVTYPLDELFAVVCLEATLAGAVVVGENLGIVPPAIDEALATHRVLGIHVGADHLSSFATGSRQRASATDVAMLTTHDGVPLAGWWAGVDVERSHKHGLIDDAERQRQLDERQQERWRVVDQLTWDGRLHERDNLGATMVATVEDLAAQAAPIVIFNLEDLWLEDRPQNTPGTFQEEPNWRRTATLTLADLRHDEGINETCRRIVNARANSVE